MILSLSSGAPPTLTTRVLIVGAGPVGIALFERLAIAGVEVLLVDKGGLTAVSAAAQDDTELINESFNGTRARGIGLGGGSQLWGGQLMRLPREVFEPRPWLGLNGWPLTADELIPYYSEAEQMLGVSRTRQLNRVDRWAPVSDRLLAVDESFFAPNRRMAPLARAAEKRHANADILLDASLVQLTRQGDIFERALFRTHNGGSCSVSFREVVLAMGSVENARQLLLPDAVPANADCRRHIGLHLEDHAHGRIAVAEGPAAAPIMRQFGMHRSIYGKVLPKLALSASAQRTEGLLSVGGVFEPTFTADGAESVARKVAADVMGRSVSIGTAQHLLGLAKRPRSAVSLATQLLGIESAQYSNLDRVFLHGFVEQDADTPSRVTLSDRVDPYGLPSARVEWSYGDREIESLRRYRDICLNFISRRWGVIMRPTDSLDSLSLTDNNHMTGTTRMSVNSRSGVVDTDLKLHSAVNLFVGGGSVFPSAGYQNPTLTMLALALRLGDHLVARGVNVT